MLLTKVSEEEYDDERTCFPTQKEIRSVGWILLDLTPAQESESWRGKIIEKCQGGLLSRALHCLPHARADPVWRWLSEGWWSQVTQFTSQSCRFLPSDLGSFSLCLNFLFFKTEIIIISTVYCYCWALMNRSIYSFYTRYMISTWYMISTP